MHGLFDVLFKTHACTCTCTIDLDIFPGKNVCFQFSLLNCPMHYLICRLEAAMKLSGSAAHVCV